MSKARLPHLFRFEAEGILFFVAPESVRVSTALLISNRLIGTHVVYPAGDHTDPNPASGRFTR